MLRSRRFYARVAVAPIAVSSLRQFGQQNRANMTTRLAAWNPREMQRLEHKAQRLRVQGRWCGRGRRGAWPVQVTRPDDHGSGCGR